MYALQYQKKKVRKYSLGCMRDKATSSKKNMTITTNMITAIVKSHSSGMLPTSQSRIQPSLTQENSHSQLKVGAKERPKGEGQHDSGGHVVCHNCSHATEASAPSPNIATLDRKASGSSER